MNTHHNRTWLFAPTRQRVKSPQDCVTFLCPDNLLYERSFVDPQQHYLWRRSLWKGSLINEWNCAADRSFVLSRSQLAEPFRTSPPSEIATVCGEGATYALFVFWLSDAVYSLGLPTQVTWIDGNSIPQLVPARSSDGHERQQLTTSLLQSFATDWRCFCSGDEGWLARQREPPLAMHHPESFPQVVASVIRKAKGHEIDRNFDQEILHHLKTSDWKPLKTIFGEIIKRGQVLPEELFVRRFLALGMASTPALVDVDTDFGNKSCFSAIRARLTTAGLKFRDDRDELLDMTPPLWIGGFDAR
jgi:hypothetical protein